jgi:hypothetical protein
MLLKQKALIAAIGGALAGISSVASAVSPGTDGTGSYLNYPYYTVNNDNFTLVSVVNSTASAKVVKVRFYDGKNTQEVLDFNLFLSPYDVWTASLTKGTNGEGVVKTSDTSCTVPAIPAAGVSFRNSNFTEVDADGNVIDNSLARTAEGYMEIIEMGTLINAASAANLSSGSSTISAFTASKHGSTGVPRDCAALAQLYSSATTVNAAIATPNIGPIAGGLFGSGSVLNVAQGVDYSYDANAFTNIVPAGVNLHNAPGNSQPNFAQFDSTARWFDNNGNVFQATYLDGIDALSATMMRSAVMAEWITDKSIGAGTDIVMNFPTKSQYITYGSSPVVCTAPVDPAFPPFTGVGATEGRFCTAAGAPARVAIRSWDREEQEPSTGLDFSPTTTPGTPSLPWEVTTVTIDNSRVLGSNLSRNVIPPRGTSGWIRFDFDLNGTTSLNHLLTAVAGSTRNGVACPAQITQYGLPTTGFSVQKYSNGNVGGVLSNYGGNFGLRYERRSTGC